MSRCELRLQRISVQMENSYREHIFSRLGGGTGKASTIVAGRDHTLATAVYLLSAGKEETQGKVSSISTWARSNDHKNLGGGAYVCI